MAEPDEIIRRAVTDALELDPAVHPAYAYLLGIYLGDGNLWQHGPNSWSLNVTLDGAYPEIVKEVGHAIRTLRHPTLSVRRDPRCAAFRLASYWALWPRMLPQHGAGRKHHRRIALAGWQREIVTEHPKPLLRGLIQTDGWRGLNRVCVKGHTYAYPRYQFSNRSDDIRRIFTDACDLLGVGWRPWGRWHISVARRESVALLDTFIGPKE